MGAVAIDIDPIIEPIVSAVIKTQLRIDGTEEDDNISLYIPMARKSVELDSGITLVKKTVKMQYEGPEHKYYLKHDTQETTITSMVYTDTEGTVVTVTDAVLYNSGLPNYVKATIPTDACDIKIEYIATPNPGHPVLSAIIERLTAMLTYNMKVKNQSMAAYWDIIGANKIANFG